MFTYTWIEGEDDNEGVDWIEITDPSGEEYAVIIHRHTDHPDDGRWRSEKQERAQNIVAALNAWSDASVNT